MTHEASSRRILTITGGHPYDVDAFDAMLGAVCSVDAWRWAHAVQPDGQAWLHPAAGRWDAVLLYDLPGIRLRRGEPPTVPGPTPAAAAAVAALLEHGQGIVALHHALGGWPHWDGWASVLGGRYHFAPGDLRGRRWPSSGQCFTSYRVLPVDDTHPVCAGIAVFEVTDELYCCPVFESEIVPLLRTDADLDPARFDPTYEHIMYGPVHGVDCTQHPPASVLLGWATVAGNSPIVYLLPGPNASTMQAEPYRSLVRQALAWVMSPEAHEWARAHARPVDAHVALPA